MIDDSLSLDRMKDEEWLYKHLSLVHELIDAGHERLKQKPHSQKEMEEIDAAKELAYKAVAYATAWLKKSK